MSIRRRIARVLRSVARRLDPPREVVVHLNADARKFKEALREAERVTRRWPQ